MSRTNILIISILLGGIVYLLIGNLWNQWEANVQAWLRLNSGGDPKKIVELASSGELENAPSKPFLFSILSFPIVRYSIGANGGKFTEFAHFLQSAFWAYWTWALQVVLSDHWKR